MKVRAIFTVDSKNQLSASGTNRFTYDANGNLTWTTNLSTTEQRNYQYDDENRLVSWYYYTNGPGLNGGPKAVPIWLMTCGPTLCMMAWADCGSGSSTLPIPSSSLIGS